MPFVEITEKGVRWSELVTVKVHPAADLFPMASEDEIAELMADIQTHGLHRPVAITPNREILEGRGRWIACTRAKIRPVTFTVRENPWLYVLEHNAAKIATMSDGERLMLVARIPRLPTGGLGAKTRAAIPTPDEIERLTGIARYAHRRASVVHRDGVHLLQDAVREGIIPLRTAERIAGLAPSEQEEVVNRIRRGENPRFAVPVAIAPEGGRLRARTKPVARSTVLARAAIEKILDTGEAAQLVVQRCDALDPDINPEDAQKLLSRLNATMRTYRTVSGWLAARKDSPSE